MTLYRTYRPKTFKEVVGRDDITRILTEQLKTNTLAHAYLFSGIRGTGKTTLARLLAKAANCAAMSPETGEPCNACPSCASINENRSSDLVEIDAASNRRIEEVRQLREHVKYVPASSRYKVYIIDEAHMLTREAANALLKTLEEPPSHAIFILATTELEKIPDTIFSRCQHFSFGRVGLSDMRERLRAVLAAEGVHMDESVVADIARRSSGSLRDAESLLGQILSMGKPEVTVEDARLFLPKVPFGETAAFLAALIARDAKAALALIAALEEQGINITFFLENCLEYSRQMLLFSATRDADRLALYFSQDEVKEIQELAREAGQNRLREITVELLKASHDLSLAPDTPSLALELAVVLLCADSEPQAGLPEGRATLSSRAPARDLDSQSVKKDPAKTKIIEPAPAAASKPTEMVTASLSTPNHSLEEILDGWGEVLAKARDKNHALNFVLGVAEPIAVSGDTLELAFKYRLQQEKVLEFKNRETVETIIKEVYGTSYRIAPTLQATAQAGNGAQNGARGREDDALLKAALEIFKGAEILN